MASGSEHHSTWSDDPACGYSAAAAAPVWKKGVAQSLGFHKKQVKWSSHTGNGGFRTVTMSEFERNQRCPLPWTKFEILNYASIRNRVSLKSWLIISLDDLAQP